MKKIILSSLFLFGISMGHAEMNLQTDLETCYKKYTDAINNHDLENVQKNMSEHGFTHLKNYIASQKLKYPEDFVIEASSKMVILKRERFLTVKENANTAKSVYYGKSFNYSKALIVLSFVKEGDTWKFDDIEEKSSNEIITNIESNNLTFLQTEYVPSGIIPSTEAEVSSVDYSGLFNLQATGYNVSLKINGITQNADNGNVVNGVILGGLKDGKNSVEIGLTPKENANNLSIRLSIRGYISNAERDVLHIYEATPGTSISKEFEVKIYDDAH